MSIRVNIAWPFSSKK